MTPISEFAAKAQWSLGTMGTIGSGWAVWLAEHYRVIGSIGILVGILVGLHGAYWLHRISKLRERKLLEGDEDGR